MTRTETEPPAWVRQRNRGMTFAWVVIDRLKSSPTTTTAKLNL